MGLGPSDTMIWPYRQSKDSCSNRARRISFSPRRVPTISCEMRGMKHIYWRCFVERGVSVSIIARRQTVSCSRGRAVPVF